MDISISQIQDNEIQSAKLEDDYKVIRTHTSARRQPNNLQELPTEKVTRYYEFYHAL